MKIVKQIKPAAIMLLLVLLLQSCQDKSAMLIKTWRIEDLRYPTGMSPDLKITVDNWVNKMRTSFSLTYNTDGSYTTKLDETVSKGTWKMNWNSTKITSVGPDGVAKDFKVLELNDKKFSFETLEGTEKVIFIMIPADK